MINSLEKLEIVKVRGEAAQILGGLAVAATGGEMRSNYFQNRALPKMVSSLALLNNGESPLRHLTIH